MLRPYSPSDLVLARRPPITPLFHSFYILPTQHTSHFATHFSSPLRPTFAPNEKLFARASGNIITSALFFLASFFQLLLLLLLPSGRILCGILAKGKILLKFRRKYFSFKRCAHLNSRKTFICIKNINQFFKRSAYRIIKGVFTSFQEKCLPIFKRHNYRYVCTSVYQSAWP